MDYLILFYLEPTRKNDNVQHLDKEWNNIYIFIFFIITLNYLY